MSQKWKKNIFFHTEFVSYPVDKLNHDQEGQQVDAKTKIFHFQPLGVHAYIQVCIEKKYVFNFNKIILNNTYQT